MWLKFFIPPVVPCLLLFGFAMWRSLMPSEFVEGRLDDAAIAAGMLQWWIPFYFLLCFILNAIDQSFDSEAGGVGPWFWTLLLCAVIASLFVWGGGSEMNLVVIAVAGTVLPMSAVRRWNRSGDSLAQRFVDALGDL